MNDLYTRLKPGRPKHIKYNEVVKLRKEGYTYDNIAYILEMKRSTVSTICKKEHLHGFIKNKPIKGEINASN